MSQAGRILILDDDELWRTLYSSVLEEAGYEVLLAPDAATARGFLNRLLIQLLITDIRLSEKDEMDAEGMSLVQWLVENGQAGGFETLIISGYSTKDQMRKAFAEFAVLDVLSKEDYSDDVFLSVVASAFESERLNRNPTLAIEFEDKLSVADFVADLKAFPTLESYSNERLAEECLELLMRLFREANSITIRPQQVLKLNQVSARVDVRYGPEMSQTQIIQVGPWDIIEGENKQLGVHFRDLVTPLQQVRRTPLLGGIVYSIPNLAAFNLYRQEVENLRQQVHQLEVNKELLEVNKKILDEQLTTAAHQINMPVNQAKGILELVMTRQRKRVALGEQETWLVKAIGILESIAPLISEYTNMIRLQTDMSLTLQRFDVINCIKRALQASEATIVQKELELKLDGLPATGLEIECDPLFITQALQNVIENSCKFTERGWIEITVNEEGKEVRIAISDSGIGISEQALPYIFEYGFREHTNSNGMGVGLSFVKKVIEKHAGTVGAESVPGKGTTIFLRLPKHQT